MIDDDDDFWGELNDEERHQVEDLADLIATIDRRQVALERLVDRDPVGMVWFGQSDEYDRHRRDAGYGGPDEWIDKRLDGETPK
jgi:hypothetical protein